MGRSKPATKARKTKSDPRARFHQKSPAKRADLGATSSTLSAAASLAIARRLRQVGSFEYEAATGILRWSDEIFRLYGVSPRRFRPTPENERALWAPAARETIPGIDALVAQGASRWPELSEHRCEYEIRRPSGEVRVLRRDCDFVLDEDGRLMGLVGTIEDVTGDRNAAHHRQSLEAQLRHAQKTDMLGTLSAGIVHDLNNLLLPILTLVELVIDTAEPGSRSADIFRIIRDAAQRGRRLAAQILAFARKDSSDRRKIDLGGLVESSLAMLRAVLSSTIRIAAAIEPSPPIIGDPEQLQQVLVNLVTNAAQAIGEHRHGRIDVTLSPLPDGSGVRLTVVDDGCGMDEATLGRAFEPFFTTRGASDGSGLGLSVVHSIVTEHGGRIRLDSTVGRGTTVEITFDAANPTRTL